MGAARGRPGEAPLALLWGVRRRALSHPRPLVLWGVLPGPTTDELWLRGSAGMGTCHQPHSARSCELPLRSVGAAEGRPWGVPLAWAWGFRGRALSLPRPLVLWNSAARAHYPMAAGSEGAGVGTRHQPHSARSCELALRAVGATRGRPGGAPLAWVWGVRGRTLSQTPPARPLGRAAGAHYPLAVGRGLWAWGPVTNATARALASWLCALCGRHKGARGGAPLACVWSVRGRALSDPRPLVLRGVLPLPTTRWLWVGGYGRGDPSPTPQRALLRAGFVRCVGGTRAPGGGASCLCVGSPGSGALPPPTARP